MLFSVENPNEDTVLYDYLFMTLHLRNFSIDIVQSRSLAPLESLVPAAQSQRLASLGSSKSHKPSTFKKAPPSAVTGGGLERTCWCLFFIANEMEEHHFH